MLARLINRSRVDNRELKILAQDLKDEADESDSQLVEHEADEARNSDRDRLQLPAGSAVLYSQSPEAGSGTTRAGKLQS
jgi:hypothetical protein